MKTLYLNAATFWSTGRFHHVSLAGTELSMQRSPSLLCLTLPTFLYLEQGELVSACKPLQGLMSTDWQQAWPSGCSGFDTRATFSERLFLTSYLFYTLFYICFKSLSGTFYRKIFLLFISCPPFPHQKRHSVLFFFWYILGLFIGPGIFRIMSQYL